MGYWITSQDASETKRLKEVQVPDVFATLNMRFFSHKHKPFHQKRSSEQQDPLTLAKS